MDDSEALMMARDFSQVCVLLPAFNEARHIESCLRDTRAAFPGARILVVDNNSTDNTADIAREQGVWVATERAPGKGRAVSTGMLLALEAGCQWIALHDADNEYDAGHLAALVTACQQAGPLSVMGVGLREVPLGHVLWRSLLANFVARGALKLALHMTPPSDILTGARVLSADLARVLFASEAGRAPYKGFELETALTRRAMRAGAQLVSAPVRYCPRPATEKKIKARDMLGILKAAWNA
ncbi:glycosyltransferase family 2 protein [Burkholderia multivorans]|uniref:glycosyltransferase family 2 protein n=1 Tax=Burkholderia multivorans TaxID=87883 RepID=UPI001C24CAAA|nr:glycosyltransferase family 2 protein [Burkholderia multivorans]MDN8079033.1 glycosyltransferase family 2 protein [Burkholderia multivorans]